MERISSVWAELQKTNRLPSGTLMSSCQTELQDLMYQLDVMLSSKKQEWLQETEDLQTRLQAKERELRSQQTALEIKTREMEDMKNQMEGLNKAQKSIVDEYEDHLSKLRAEVLKVRREYEKLHKQHQRYKRDLQRKKDQVLEEKKESQEEITTLRRKIEEFEGRERDWEMKVRGQQHEMDMLEAQKRTLVEKCEFIQQQARTYQSQVGRRRDMQDTSEDAFNSRIGQLEASVDRSTQTIVAQKEKIEKLKGSLEDAMTSHKQTMGDNEKLLGDLQRANETIQMLEERIAELEGQLYQQSERLRTAQEDTHQYSSTLARLEKTLNAKDDIIKHMGETHEYEESEQIKRLNDALQAAREDLKHVLRTNIQKANTVWSHKHGVKNGVTSSICATGEGNTSQNQHTSPQRHSGKESESTPEILRLQLEVNKLQEALSAVEGSHSSELGSMRRTLGELTTELHQRNSSLDALSQRSCDLEQSFRDESGTLDKKVSELKVSQPQLEMLLHENRQLRQDLLHFTGQEYNSRNSPNTQSSLMRREMNVLRNSVEDVEHLVRSQHNSARTDTSQHSLLSSKHSGSQGEERYSATDDYLDSSIRRYDDQLHYLEEQKARLEAQMSQSSRHNLRLVAEERRMHEGGSRSSGGNAHYAYHPDNIQGGSRSNNAQFAYHPDDRQGGSRSNNAQFAYHSDDSQGGSRSNNAQYAYHPDDSQGSEAMSLVSQGPRPKVDRLQLPQSSSEDELPDMAEEASKAFYSQEHEHAHQLERRLDAQINNFTHGLDN